MASRIPQPKSKPAAPAPTPTTDNTSVPAIHAALQRLDAPPISVDELERLHRGPLGGALDFLATHLVGRQSALAARGILHEHAADARGEDARAALRLAGMTRSADVSRTQLDERHRVLENSRAEVRELQMQLDQRRLATLLLKVLAKKTEVRARRFAELRQLLDELRARAQGSHWQLKGLGELLADLTDAAQARSIDALPATNLTKDALSTLHMHHIRLSKLASSSPSRDSTAQEAERQLRFAVARRMNAPETDLRVIAAVKQLYTQARNRSRTEVQYTDEPSGRCDYTHQDLGDLADSNADKGQQLQGASDLYIGLGLSVEHLIKSISVFEESALANLRSALEEEAASTKGHLEILQRFIAHPSVPHTMKKETDNFDEQVRELYGMRGSVAKRSVLQHTENLIRHAYERESFLTNASISMESPSPATDVLISEYETAERIAQEHISSLLRRKLDKVRVGQKVVEDIETLVQESRAVTGT